MALEVRHIELLNGGDNQGALLLREEKVVALLSRLGPDHEDTGHWFVEWFSGGIIGLPKYVDLDAASLALGRRIPAWGAFG
jgi:hypothetical protein